MFGDRPDENPGEPQVIRSAERLVTYPDCDHAAGFDLFDICRMCKRPRELESDRFRAGPTGDANA